MHSTTWYLIVKNHILLCGAQRSTGHLRSTAVKQCSLRLSSPLLLHSYRGEDWDGS
jgi:hypothetical protein